MSHPSLQQPLQPSSHLLIQTGRGRGKRPPLQNTGNKINSETTAKEVWKESRQRDIFASCCYSRGKKNLLGPLLGGRWMVNPSRTQCRQQPTLHLQVLSKMASVQRFPTFIQAHCYCSSVTVKLVREPVGKDSICYPWRKVQEVSSHSANGYGWAPPQSWSSHLP